jgi:hypothetical protein
MSVFKTPYEIVGEGIATAKAFYAERDAAEIEQWKIVKQFGAKGLRPGWRGSVRSLFFKEVPSGFRQIGKDASGLLECVPHKGSKIGKDAAKALATAVQVPEENALADLFGWAGRRPVDGVRGLIFNATATRVTLPSVRYLLMLPREEGDGFNPPASLIELKQSEYAKAFEDHNAAVRAREVA